MKKSLRSLIVFTLTVTAMFSTSCLDNTENRTFEQELQELNELILRLHDEGYDVDTTDLGIYYIVHEPGEGPYPVEGDTLTIRYEGFFTDGSMFDSSDPWAPDGWEFVYLRQPLIVGFNDGLAVMNKGSEVELIIPSNLAYGAYGTDIIGPYTTLIFGVKMEDLRPAKK